MSFHRLITLAAAALTTALLVAAGGVAHETIRPVEGSIATGAGKLAYEAYLPSGYATSGLRYPVLYFLHGLPANGAAYRSVGWLERALDAAGKPAILVAPQGARASEPDPEYVGKWERAIAVDLPRRIDARYRTIPSRKGRAMIGVSAGGYGAMHIVLAHLPEYSVVESWSGYFHPTDPTGTRARDLGSSGENAAANVHRQFVALESRLDGLPLYIAFYVGRRDPIFVPENEQLNHELSGAGVAHVFRIYAGGHDQALWAAEAPAWLRLALNHLAPAR